MLRTRQRGDMGEFEGDVAATDKGDPARQFGEVQEIGAVDQSLGTGKFQRPRLCARSNQCAAKGDLAVAVDLDPVLGGEARAAM